MSDKRKLFVIFGITWIVVLVGVGSIWGLVAWRVPELRATALWAFIAMVFGLYPLAIGASFALRKSMARLLGIRGVSEQRRGA